MTKRRLETLGGIGSMVVGLLCLGLGIMDHAHRESIWIVWLIMFLVLEGNGLAMVRHMRPLAALTSGDRPRV